MPLPHRSHKDDPFHRYLPYQGPIWMPPPPSPSTNMATPLDIQSYPAMPGAFPELTYSSGPAYLSGPSAMIGPYGLTSPSPPIELPRRSPSPDQLWQNLETTKRKSLYPIATGGNIRRSAVTLVNDALPPHTDPKCECARDLQGKFINYDKANRCRKDLKKRKHELRDAYNGALIANKEMVKKASSKLDQRPHNARAYHDLTEGLQGELNELFDECHNRMNAIDHDLMKNHLSWEK